MNSSLEKLVKNLLDYDFKYLTQKFGFKNLELLKQKDAYSYEYIDSFKIFFEEKLPNKKYFYRSLKDGTTDVNGKKLNGDITDEEYLTCIKILNKFNMKNIDDYHDYYLKEAVLLLADVFEKFINTCLKFCTLDPCHCFSFPGLSWDAMLKTTKIKLEQISDIDKYLFLEKGLRGGISYICKRFSEANNKDIKNSDTTKPSKYIMYFDKTTYMDGQWVDIFLVVDLNG